MAPYFTSGKRRAELGPANHDQYPYLWPSGGRTSAPSKWGGSRDGRYMPRPEFNVPENPILAAFRGRLRYQRDVGREVSPSRLASIWLRDVEGYYGPLPKTPEQIDHARRVLSKLAVLT